MSDTAQLAGRHLRLMSRRPSSIIGAIVLPLVFAFLFFTVLNGVMERAGVDYAQYVIPAVVLQAMFFSAISASVWAAEDASGGMSARLRSMPISRTAPVLSLLVGELVRALLSLVVLVIAGYGFGFRFERGAGYVLLFVALAIGCAAAACAGYIVLGFAIAKVEQVQAIGGLLYYPLLLVSNLFVPAEAFPGWLQPLVENQPVSRIADALRAVSTLGHEDLGRTILIAVLWIAGLLTAFTFLAPRAFGRVR
ncbi:ABC transporter permease [Aeromicrobium sp. PE09-221]|uniref:ABC transporter permease n=1 Tax=Aeromicrobium sp. PE09-221 TaxID=1898043 RepID=UPI00191C8774|nr:ABC transporter permease [Aeromicrobium sp. PE09-221]